MKKRTWVIIVAIPMLGLIACRIYIAIFFSFAMVPTGSMANTIIPGDHIVATSRVGEVRRGDVILFKPPHNQKVRYISRVIGLPGEQIDVRERSVLVNGQELPEQRVTVQLAVGAAEGKLTELKVEPAPPAASYKVYYAQGLEHDNSGASYGANGPIIVPPGHYFVMGDCRDNSFDSRYWGFLPRALIVGKPFLVAYSIAPGGQGQKEEVRRERFFIPIK